MADITLDTTATVPSGTSITVWVYEYTNGATGEDLTGADNFASQSISDGTNSYSLSGFNASSGNAYRIAAEMTPGSSASLESATVSKSTTSAGSVLKTTT